MRLHIEDDEGRRMTLLLGAPATTTVLQVKQRVERRWAVPVAEQSLLHGSAGAGELPDAAALGGDEGLGLGLDRFSSPPGEASVRLRRRVPSPRRVWLAASGDGGGGSGGGGGAAARPRVALKEVSGGASLWEVKRMLVSRGFAPPAMIMASAGQAEEEEEQGKSRQLQEKQKQRGAAASVVVRRAKDGTTAPAVRVDEGATVAELEAAIAAAEGCAMPASLRFSLAPDGTLHSSFDLEEEGGAASPPLSSLGGPGIDELGQGGVADPFFPVYCRGVAPQPRMHVVSGRQLDVKGCEPIGALERRLCLNRN